MRTSQKAEELRSVFRQAYERPIDIRKSDTVAFLRVLIVGEPFALRVSEIAEVQAKPKITWLPTQSREFLGVTSLRGEMIPVYSLGELIGRSASEARDGWLIYLRHSAPVGVFISEYGGFVEASPQQVYSRLLNIGGQVHSIIELADIINRIESIAGTKETGTHG